MYINTAIISRNIALGNLKMTHKHNFIQDNTRKHGRAGRCFVTCECGAQASLLTGKRFTTARPKKDPKDVKKSAGLKTSLSTKQKLKRLGFRSEQDFF